MATRTKNTIKPILMDAGRAYPPTGAGSLPNVSRVARKQAWRSTAGDKGAAVLRPLRVAADRATLKTASAPSDASAHTASRLVAERGEDRVPTIGAASFSEYGTIPQRLPSAFHDDVRWEHTDRLIEIGT